MEDMGQTEETFETEVRRKVTRTAFKIEEVSGEMAITLKCKLVISSYLSLEMIIVWDFGLPHPSSSGQEIKLLHYWRVVGVAGWPLNGNTRLSPITDLKLKYQSRLKSSVQPFSGSIIRFDTGPREDSSLVFLSNLIYVTHAVLYSLLKKKIKCAAENNRASLLCACVS